MHLADGIVTSPTLLVGVNLVGAGAIAVAARRVDMDDGRRVAWAGMLAGFLLAAQAVNVPLLPGTSAHVIGTSLVTLAVGPALGIVAVAAVLLVQAFAFGDGGITVVGANVLTMAVIPALSVACAARVFGVRGRGLVLTAVFGTLLGSTLGAAALAALLVFGAGGAANIAFPWLVGVQALAAVAEGILTAMAIGGLPSNHGLRQPSREKTESEGSALAWAAIAIGIAVLLVPFASKAPDALERVIPRLASE
jgi:cobalt/nickel transport system permease protein